MAGNAVEDRPDRRLSANREQACFGHMGSMPGHVGPVMPPDLAEEAWPL